MTSVFLPYKAREVFSFPFILRIRNLIFIHLKNSFKLYLKVRYVMRCIFGDPKNAPPPLKKLTPEETVSYLWKGEGSLVEELLQSMDSYVEEDLISDLKSKIRAHDPSGSDDIRKELQQSLLW